MTTERCKLYGTRFSISLIQRQAHSDTHEKACGNSMRFYAHARSNGHTKFADPDNQTSNLARVLAQRPNAPNQIATISHPTIRFARLF